MNSFTGVFQEFYLYFKNVVLSSPHAPMFSTPMGNPEIRKCYRLLWAHQSGIWANDFCLDQLLPIVHNIYTVFDRYPTLESCGVFLDMPKAFDKVRFQRVVLKVTSTTKPFLSQNEPWCVINYFYLKKKSCFVLEISRFLCFCEILKFPNLWHHHRHCHIVEVTLPYFFWILSSMKMKFGRILVCCMTSISNMFLTQNWRPETSSRPFYDFIKTI